MNQMNLELGRILRDAGCKSVAANNRAWMDTAISRLEYLYRSGDVMTGEQIRKVCELHGIRPVHPNAWGALTGTLVRRGFLRDSGKTVQMEDPKSHARRTPLWVWA